MAVINDVYPKLFTNARTGQNSNVDHSTGHLAVVDTAHRYVHLGVHFFHTVTAVVDSAGLLFHLLLTPAHGDENVECHLLYRVSTSLSADIELWEGVTGTDPAVVPFNSRRASTSTPEALVGSATTGYTAGTLLDKYLAGTNGGNRDGGLKSRDDEIILAPSTLYAVKITSNINANRVSSQLSWYEAGANTIGG